MTAATTSLKLPLPLKDEIAGLASKLGISTHGFMVDALQRAVRDAKLRQQFYDDGAAALAEAEAGGPTYDMDDVHTYFRAKLKAKPENRASIPMPKSVAEKKKEQLANVAA